MPDEDKTTNTNQPLTGGTPAVDQPDPAAEPTTPTTSPTTTPPPDISDQAIDTPPPPPMEDGAVSPPPPIVEEKKPEETTAPTQETGTAEGDQAIPDIPPVITTSGAGGKKPANKKMIATILGVLFLVGGIGAGVILVQNQQDIREWARVIADCERDSDCGGDYKCVNGDCVLPSTPAPTLAPTSAPTPAPTSNWTPSPGCIADDQCLAPGESCCSSPSSGYFDNNCPVTESICREEGGTACIMDGYCLEGVQDVCCNLSNYDDPTCTTPIKKRCGTGPTTPTTAPVTPEPTATPTLPPGVTASCLNIQAFNTEWNSITTLSSLVAGDVVRFTVAGNASSGSFDKARFTINGTLRSDVSVKRPGTDEFYDEYTIPEDATTFTIKAEVHHSSLGWF